VPVIVKRSSTVGHVPLTLTLLILLLLVIAEIPYSDLLWVKPWAYVWPFLIVVIYYLSHIVSRLPWIQKVLVPERDEVDQVHQRAHLEFFLNKIDRTRHHTGILIFISVMEKKAVILADEGISSKLPPETWNEVLKKLGEQLRQGNWGFGFIEAIESCGHHLKTHFPLSETKDNELKNQLVIR
ncbi:MAG TPA: TPM domain-containing protein, partial [Bdellovibrio sp.]|nr:TPM domain-containing protein [Bdellovibrio sp.]